MTHISFDHILDGLVEKGYVIYDNFLTTTEVLLLLEEFKRRQESGLFRPAGIGRGADFQRARTIRGDYIQWIDRSNVSERCHFFFARLEDFILYINRTCFLGIKSAEMHFAVYEPGAFYKRHLDVFKESQGRVLSFICYLNPDWQEEDGGQLRIYLPGDQTLDILPLGGRVVCFRSDQYEHEVLPAKTSRRSLTGWLRNREPLL